MATSNGDTWQVARHLVRSGTPALVVIADGLKEYGPLHERRGIDGRATGLFHARRSGVDIWLADSARVQHPRQVTKDIVRLQVERTALAAVAAASVGRPPSIILRPDRVAPFFKAAYRFFSKPAPYGVDAAATDVAFVDHFLHGADWQAIVDALSSDSPEIMAGLSEREQGRLVQVVGAIYNTSNSVIQTQGIASYAYPTHEGEISPMSEDAKFSFHNQDSQIVNQGQNTNTGGAIYAQGPLDILDPQILAELSAVRDVMRSNSSSVADKDDTDTVDAALDRLEKKDGSGALEVLKGVAKKVLQVATDIGSKVLAEFLKAQFGLQ